MVWIKGLWGLNAPLDSVPLLQNSLHSRQTLCMFIRKLLISLVVSVTPDVRKCCIQSCNESQWELCFSYIKKKKKISNIKCLKGSGLNISHWLPRLFYSRPPPPPRIFYPLTSQVFLKNICEILRFYTVKCQ